MTNLYYSTKKILNLIKALNYSLTIRVLYILLTSFLVINLVQNFKFNTTIHTLRTPQYLSKIKHTCPRSNISLEFIKDCVERLLNIKLYKKHKRYIELTKDFLTDPNFLVLACIKMKNNLNDTNPVLDKKILNGINKSWFIKTAYKIRSNKYKFKPTKVINLLKIKDSTYSTLVVNSSKDKIVQKAISLVINQIYEYEDKTFLNTSHGFRPNYSIHTALKQVKTLWLYLNWFIRDDLDKAFNKIQCNILINLINRKIRDQRLINFIRILFNCKTLTVEKFYFKTNKNILQADSLAPLLYNIYLQELDEFMESLKRKYNRGSYLKKNKEYFKRLNLPKYERVLKNDLWCNKLYTKRRQLYNKGTKEYLHDDNYIRVWYVRHAQNILVGVVGSKLLAEKIKIELVNWLKSNLHMKLKDKKTELVLREALSLLANKINFLGFNLYRPSFNQTLCRNSRRLEKIKRLKARIVSYKNNIKNILIKQIKLDFTKTIQQRLKNRENVKSITYELGNNLINILDDKIRSNYSYRMILRKLELNLLSIVAGSTDKNIENIVSYLTRPEFLTALNKNTMHNNIEKSTYLNSKLKLLKLKNVSTYTNLLRIGKYGYYETKDNSKLVTTDQLRNSNHIVELLNNKKITKTKASIYIKVNWERIVGCLHNRKFLNKKNRPSSVLWLISFGVAHIIKYFYRILHGYLLYFRCADDFNTVKKRLYWYFKYSLVSTLKSKFKLNSRSKIFCRYGINITCLDKKGKKVSFIKSENVKKMKRGFLTTIPIEDLQTFLDTTFITTQTSTSILNTCAIKKCEGAYNVQRYHVSNVSRGLVENPIVIQSQRKKLKNWEIIYSIKKNKQLPLCKRHYRLMYENKINKSMIYTSYLISFVH
nr:hypothetical protein [Porphyridium purpureum]